MSQTFGMESHGTHAQTPVHKPVRYLMIIDAGGLMIARLFLDTLEMVTEIDAAVEDVGSMIAGVIPVVGALGSEWDVALAGHSVAERAAARIYTLAI